LEAPVLHREVIFLTYLYVGYPENTPFMKLWLSVCVKPYTCPSPQERSTVIARQSQRQSAYHKRVISFANVQEGQQTHRQFSQLRNEEGIADRAMKTTFKRNVKGFSFISVSA